MAVVVIWLAWPSAKGSAPQLGGSSGELIDPSDPRQVAELIGLTRGSIPDAVTAAFVLRRFEDTHGRKASTHDVGLLLGLMKSLKP